MGVQFAILVSIVVGFESSRLVVNATLELDLNPICKCSLRGSQQHLQKLFFLLLQAMGLNLSEWCGDLIMELKT